MKRSTGLARNVRSETVFQCGSSPLSEGRFPFLDAVPHVREYVSEANSDG